MLKNTSILIQLFISFMIYSQSDVTKQKNVIHLVGLDAGYTSYDRFVDFKGEANLNYLFNPYYFCAKIQLGVAPGTKFGALKKGFISIGFSTKMDRFLSWHLLLGAGIVDPSKTYNVTEYYGSNGYSQERIYTFYCHTLLLETGFYFKPIKDKRIICGFNSVINRYTIDDDVSKYPPIHGAPIINLNLSINFKL